MKIVDVIASVNVGIGGPSQSVTQLAHHLATRGEQVRLMSLDYSHLGTVPATDGAELELFPAQLMARHFRGFSPRFAAHISAAANDCDIIHNHGLWMWPNLYARTAAYRKNKPLVISPRGMLDLWARRRGRWKKALYWQLFERQPC